MLIIHGVRREKSRLGLVAELCHKCKDIRPALVQQVRQFHHVYFVPMGEKKVIGFEVTCQTCRSSLLIEQVPYISYSPQDPGDIGLLCELTNPGAVDRLEARIELDDRLARGTATKADRIAIISEVITAAALPVQAKLHNILPTTGLAMLATVVFSLVWAVMFSLPSPDPVSLYGSGAAAVISFIVFMVSATTGKSRLIRKSILPALAADLAPFNPTRPELAEALRPLVKGKVSLAIRLKADVLHNAIQRVGAP